MLSRVLIIALGVALAGCVSDYILPAGDTVTKVIHGTDSVPDPLLDQVQELEKLGILDSIRIMESYPVQVEISGPVQVVSCLDSPGGRWLPAHNECENMKEGSCTSLRGGFDRCASPCRHDSEHFMCVQMCVPVCRFGEE